MRRLIFATMLALPLCAFALPDGASAEVSETTAVSNLPDDGTDALMQRLQRRGLPKTAIPADINGVLSLFLYQEAPPKEEFDPDIVSLWVYDHEKDQLRKLLTNTLPKEFSWAKLAEGETYPCTVDDVHAIHYAHLIPYTRNILLGGCPDARNIYSYIINADTHEIVGLPSNGDFGGFTPEEDFIIMFSYAYNFALDENGDPIGGRHTVIQVFDAEGKSIGSMSLEQ